MHMHEKYAMAQRNTIIATANIYPAHIDDAQRITIAFNNMSGQDLLLCGKNTFSHTRIESRTDHRHKRKQQVCWPTVNLPLQRQWNSQKKRLGIYLSVG